MAGYAALLTFGASQPRPVVETYPTAFFHKFGNYPWQIPYVRETVAMAKLGWRAWTGKGGDIPIGTGGGIDRNPHALVGEACENGL